MHNGPESVAACHCSESSYDLMAAVMIFWIQTSMCCYNKVHCHYNICICPQEHGCYTEVLLY